MNINPLALPSLPLAQRAALPDAPAIYFALAEDGAVLYIGKAKRLVARWKSTQHHRYADISAFSGVRLAWLVVNDESLLDEIERACIEYFAPTLNKAPTHDRFQLVIPKELLAEIKEIAERDQRKTSNVMVMLMRKSLLDLKASGLSLGSSQVAPPVQ